MKQFNIIGAIALLMLGAIVARIAAADPAGQIIFTDGTPSGGGGKIKGKGAITVDTLKGWTVKSVTMVAFPNLGGERKTMPATATINNGIGTWDNGNKMPVEIAVAEMVPHTVYVEMYIEDGKGGKKTLTSATYTINP